MKTEILKLRIGEEELGEWKKKAGEAGLSLSEWIRRRCELEARMQGQAEGTAWVANPPKEVELIRHVEGSDNSDLPRVPDDSVLERGAVSDGGFFGKPAYQEHSRSCQCGVCGFAREAGLK